MSVMTNKSHSPLRNSYTAPTRPARQTPAAVRKRRGTAPVAETMDFHAGAMRKAAIWVGGLLTVMFLFLGFSYGLLQAYRAFTTSEFFVIDQVSVNGVRTLTEEDIISLSGIRLGENSFLTHIPNMEKRLLQNPWIESVTIKRSLPDNFIITIKEREAKFLALKDNSLFYLDSEGHLIDQVDGSHFQSLPILDIGSGGEESLSLLSRFMETISNSDIPFDISQISWLRISAGKGFELYWENKQLSFSIDIENWEGNLRRLCLVIKDMEMRNEIDKIKEIRASDGQVWLQKV